MKIIYIYLRHVLKNVILVCHIDLFIYLQICSCDPYSIAPREPKQFFKINLFHTITTLIMEKKRNYIISKTYLTERKREGGGGM